MTSKQRGVPQSRRLPGERAGIATEDVIAAAQAVYQRTGFEGLTMRAVAREAGVAANALYSHVPDKDGLIDLLIDALLGEIEQPSARAPWDAAITSLMRESRRVLLGHPSLMTEFLARPTRGPNALRLGEATLGLLARGGVDGPAAVTALRVLLVYTLGFAAMESPRAAEPDPAGRRTRSESAFAGAGARSHALAPRLAEHPDDATFEAGLRWILAGVAGSAQAGARPDRPR